MNIKPIIEAWKKRYGRAWVHDSQIERVRYRDGFADGTEHARLQPVLPDVKIEFDKDDWMSESTSVQNAVDLMFGSSACFGVLVRDDGGLYRYRAALRDGRAIEMACTDGQGSFGPTFHSCCILTPKTIGGVSGQPVD